jgi:hypothetical protein
LFIENLLVNYSLILLSLLTGLDNFTAAFTGQAKLFLSAFAALVFALFVWCSRNILKSNRMLLMLFVGSLIAIAPFCSISYNSSRTLPMLAIGFTPLLAAVILQLWRPSESKIRTFGKRSLALIMLLPHALLPVFFSLSVTAGLMPVGEDLTESGGNDNSGRPIVYASFPLGTINSLLPYIWSGRGELVPPSMFLFASGVNAYQLTRISEDEFIADSELGFVVNQNVNLDSEAGRANAMRYQYRFVQSMISNPARNYSEGQIIESALATVEIKELDNDQIPTRIYVKFKQKPEDMQWHYWDWTAKNFDSFVYPGIGESVLISVPSIKD